MADTRWGNVDVVGGRVEFGLVVSDPKVQERLDRQYGEGTVVLYPHLDRSTKRLTERVVCLSSVR